MQGFKPQPSAQITIHPLIYNAFCIQPHLIRRSTLRQFRGDTIRVLSEAVAS